MTSDAPQVTCFECGAPCPTVRLACPSFPVRGWPVDDDERSCGAKMCSEECATQHRGKHDEIQERAVARAMARRRGGPT